MREVAQPKQTEYLEPDFAGVIGFLRQRILDLIMSFYLVVVGKLLAVAI